jgi:hypothetical protein
VSADAAWFLRIRKLLENGRKRWTVRQYLNELVAEHAISLTVAELLSG